MPEICPLEEPPALLWAKEGVRGRSPANDGGTRWCVAWGSFFWRRRGIPVGAGRLRLVHGRRNGRALHNGLLDRRRSFLRRSLSLSLVLFTHILSWQWLTSSNSLQRCFLLRQGRALVLGHWTGRLGRGARGLRRRATWNHRNPDAFIALRTRRPCWLLMRHDKRKRCLSNLRSLRTKAMSRLSHDVIPFLRRKDVVRLPLC